MGATRTLSVVLLLLASSSGVFSGNKPYIDLTNYFTVSVTSVCGDPPTPFELPQNSGQFQVCVGNEYSVDNLVDGNLDTRWQSVSGESPVDILFTIKQVCIYEDDWLTTQIHSFSLAHICTTTGGYSSDTNHKSSTLHLS